MFLSRYQNPSAFILNSWPLKYISAFKKTSPFSILASKAMFLGAFRIIKCWGLYSKSHTRVVSTVQLFSSIIPIRLLNLSKKFMSSDKKPPSIFFMEMISKSFYCQNPWCVSKLKTIVYVYD